MTYGTSLGVSMPAVGAAGPGTALAAQINACVQALIDRLETKVTVAGLDMNADLSMRSGATDYGLKDVQRISLSDVLSALSAVTYPGALYRVGSALYFNDAAGNQVRIVNAGAIDVSSTGGITGAGYGSSGVEVNWDGTNYRFKNGSGSDNYTALVADGILLRDGSGNAIRLDAPSLAADYTWPFPATLTQRTHINAAAGRTSTGTIATATTTGLLTDQTGAGEVILSLPLSNYTQLTRVYGRVSVGPTAAAMTMTVVRISAAGGATVLATVASSGTGAQTLDSGALTETISTDNQSYIVRMQMNGGVGTNANTWIDTDFEWKPV